MAEYRLLTYENARDLPQAGVLIGERVYPASDLLTGKGLDAGSVLGLLQSWQDSHDSLTRAADKVDVEKGFKLSETKLLAPIQYPAGVFCAGSNYWDHAREMAKARALVTGKEIPVTKKADPWFFMKTGAHSIVGPNAPIRLHPMSKTVDWEAELGVVIGKPARNVSVERALEYVAGYLIVNDVSARDLTHSAGREGTGFAMDWVSHKCFDDSAPMGPWITPAAFASDPKEMSIKLWVNDVIKQDSSTNQIMHGIEEQISFLSKRLTLKPGDVLATGCPAGCGAARGEFLKAGDEIRIEIGNCGVLTNTVVAGDYVV
ncbi:MAG: hypothetical protein K0Q70_1165 [Rhodospirillales bacterium]|jgi:2-keto-4-pentenoate hydratase/2-oxohepta-3-ene-1,7-dioic acid hydratase in catechol pathway|nr:hypothetical protein [Rhodospirillales bacterium]